MLFIWSEVFVEAMQSSNLHLQISILPYTFIRVIVHHKIQQTPATVL